MLYTRKGDSGTSGLFGTSKRFRKDNFIFDALGTLDELNAFLGMCRAQVGYSKCQVDSDIEDSLFEVQEVIFVIQAELAGADKKVSQSQIDVLEKAIDATEAKVTTPRSFVVPGATVLSVWFDIARTVARRAERSVLRAEVICEVSPESKAYLNRLSSLLYVVARYTAALECECELVPSY